MKGKILLTSIIGILLLTGCGKNVNIYTPNNTEVVITTENPVENNKIEFIDGIYGVYGEENSDANNEYIKIFEGKDEKHIDISASLYDDILFYVEDVEITSNTDGEVIATKLLGPEEVVWYYFENNSNLNGARLDVIIKDNKINLKFDVEIENVGKEIEKNKIDIKVITNEEKKKALDNILYSDFENINEEIFETVLDNKNYLVVKVKNYMYWESEKGKDYGEYGERGFWKNYYMESSYGIGMDKYYNIDKRNKKILELNDIIKNQDELNEYLNKAIKEKYDKELSDKIDLEEWENMDFLGIGVPKVFENYFLIDEEKKTVKIRCLGYYGKAYKEVGDICIEVPFEFFNLND